MSLAKNLLNKFKIEEAPISFGSSTIDVDNKNPEKITFNATVSVEIPAISPDNKSGNLKQFTAGNIVIEGKHSGKKIYINVPNGSKAAYGDYETNETFGTREDLLKEKDLDQLERLTKLFVRDLEAHLREFRSGDEEYNEIKSELKIANDFLGLASFYASDRKNESITAKNDMEVTAEMIKFSRNNSKTHEEALVTLIDGVELVVGKKGNNIWIEADDSNDNRHALVITGSTSEVEKIVAKEIEQWM